MIQNDRFSLWPTTASEHSEHDMTFNQTCFFSDYFPNLIPDCKATRTEENRADGHQGWRKSGDSRRGRRCR